MTFFSEVYAKPNDNKNFQGNDNLNHSNQNTGCKTGDIVVDSKTRGSFPYNKFISFYIPRDDEIINDGIPRFYQGEAFATFELLEAYDTTQYYICPTEYMKYYKYDYLLPYFKQGYAKNPEDISTWENDPDFQKIVKVIQRYRQITTLGTPSRDLNRGTGNYEKQLRSSLIGSAYGYEPSYAAGASGAFIMVVKIITHFKKANLIQDWRILHKKITAKYNDLMTNYLAYLESKEEAQAIFNVLLAFKKPIEQAIGYELNTKAVADLANIIIAKIGINYVPAKFEPLLSEPKESNIKFDYKSFSDFPKKSDLAYNKLEEILSITFNIKD